MVKAKVLKLVLDDHGAYLGMEKGCFVVKDKYGNTERYPLFEQEIGEVILKSGNMVSTGALASLGFWDIDVLILTQRGRPVAMLKGLDSESHIKTRLCQYEAINNGKGVYVANQLVLSKIESQNVILEKYDLRPHDAKAKYVIESGGSESLETARRRLTSIEGKFSELYFKQIFSLFPEKLRPESRKKFKAYDGMNNIFNLAYEVLSWKVHTAIVRAKLEPYLGFLHSVQFGKPSLVCDFQELYRYLIDDFLIQYCQNLRRKDFIVKTEKLSRSKKGKREYLNDVQTVTYEVTEPRQATKTETLINEKTTVSAGYYLYYRIHIDISGKESNTVSGRVVETAGYDISFYVFDQKGFNDWKDGKSASKYVSAERIKDYSYGFVPDHSDYYVFVLDNGYSWFTNKVPQITATWNYRMTEYVKVTKTKSVSLFQLLTGKALVCFALKLMCWESSMASSENA